MKICSNPNCESSFLFGDNKTTCPFCHAPLIDNNGAAITQQFPCTAGVDLFPCCVDIHGIVSSHVETVCLLTKK